MVLAEVTPHYPRNEINFLCYNIHMHKKGFTIIELLIVVAALALATTLFFVQKTNLDAMDRDKHRKIAINAIYYSLEESFYTDNAYYPEEISDQNLKTLDPSLFTDPWGALINTEGSTYRYEPTGCTDGHCTSYTLRAMLETEDTYIKQSRH